MRSDECHGLKLRRYFGEAPDAVSWACGDACQYCLTRTPVTTYAPAAAPAEESTDVLKKLEALVTDGTLPKNSPRLLVRFAFGVSSPRLRALKLEKLPLFGAAANKLSFDAVMAACERLCGRKDDAVSAS